MSEKPLHVMNPQYCNHKKAAYLIKVPRGSLDGAAQSGFYLFSTRGAYKNAIMRNAGILKGKSIRPHGGDRKSRSSKGTSKTQFKRNI